MIFNFVKTYILSKILIASPFTITFAVVVFARSSKTFCATPIKTSCATCITCCKRLLC